MYIADQGNNRIRKVTIATGAIITIAGTQGSYSGGNSGQATSVSLNQPSGVALDSTGISLVYTIDKSFVIVLQFSR